MTRKFSEKALFDVRGEAAEEEGTGTDPKTFAPIEFVVFKVDDVVLQFIFTHTPFMRIFVPNVATKKEKKLNSNRVRILCCSLKRQHGARLLSIV